MLVLQVLAFYGSWVSCQRGSAGTYRNTGIRCFLNLMKSERNYGSLYTPYSSAGDFLMLISLALFHLHFKHPISADAWLFGPHLSFPFHPCGHAIGVILSFR